MFSKIKDRFKQAKYYISASLCAGALFGGLTMKGLTVEAPAPVEIRCAVGDVGEGNEEEARVAQAMKEHGCQEVLHLGDNVYDTGLKGPKDKKFHDHFWDYYSGFTNVMTQGNHDAYHSTKGLEAWISLSGKYQNLIYPSHYFLYRSGDWCVFSWFSEAVERDDDTEFAKAQAEFAENLDLTGCNTKVAIAHHPYKSQGEHGNCQKNVCQFYEKYLIGKFHYILAGHDHQLSYEGEIGGSKLFVSGAGSQLRTCKSGKDQTCWESLGFLKFEGDRVEFVFVK